VNIFDLHGSVIADYRDFVRSFFSVTAAASLKRYGDRRGARSRLL